jgi:hypothetical protein
MREENQTKLESGIYAQKSGLKCRSRIPSLITDKKTKNVSDSLLLHTEYQDINAPYAFRKL